MSPESFPASFGVLLLHGFSGSPETFTVLEPRLRALGLPLALPVLRGHGQASPRAMAGVTWPDWLEDARQALVELRGRAQRVIVVGHSMGALLAALLATEHPEVIDSLVLVATPIQLASPLAPGRPLQGLTPWLGRLLPRWPLPSDFTDPALASQDTSYPWVPMGPLLSFLDLSVLVRRRLSRVVQPALIVHSRADRVVAAAAADLLVAELGTPPAQVRMAWFSRSGHELFRDCEHGAVIATVLAFIEERITRQPDAP